MPKNKGFTGNQSSSRDKRSQGVGKSGSSIPPKGTDPVEKIQSDEQANTLLPQASEKLLPQELEAIDSSAPDDFDRSELWKNAQIFALAAEQLASREKELESLQAELKVKQAELDDRNRELAEQSKLLHDEREQLNQRISELSQQERQIQEREANAAAGFLAQNRIALTQLDQQVAQLSQEIVQAYSRKTEILQQAKGDIAQKYAEFEQEVSAIRQEIEQDRQSLVLEHKQLRKEKNRLQSDQELLNEDRQALEEKISQRASAKITELETQIALREELYKRAEQREKRLAIKYAQVIDANRVFGSRSPDEILAEIEELRRQKLDLEQKLAERPTEAAARRLEDLEAQKEQWDAERFRLNTKVQELERSAATNRIAILNLETLRDEKEALEASNNRLRAALGELREEVNDAIAQDKDRSPFSKCTIMDRDERLQSVSTLYEDTLNLQDFVADLQNRIAKPFEGKQLYYSLADLRAFLGGLAMSRLHILQGISGTGKTSLPTSFARVIGGKSELIEVQAGWRDRQDLVGYFNSFEGKFYEHNFLQALYEAQCPFYRDKVYIIVLDEMNLSRPEQYFADFLSKLEQPGQPSLKFNTDITKPSPNLFESKDTLKIPQNVWFIGTANQDETTLEFADKTYDRAHVMELSRQDEQFEVSKPLARPPISYQILTRSFQQAEEQYKREAIKAFKFLKDSLANLLEQKFKIAWGNRLERQMHHYVPVVLAAGGSLTEATDHILATKILRKVRDRHDTQPADLRELHETIEGYWSELDADEPVKSLKLLEAELQRVERGAY